MAGHSVACTFHTGSPYEASRRPTTVMRADAGVKPHEANQMISDVVDLLVQIEIQHEVRRIVAITNVSKAQKNGDVFFDPIN